MNTNAQPPNLQPPASLAFLALLIAFHLVNNWLWVTTNQVVYGFDRMFHQVTSLAYYDLLREGVTLRALFAALTWSDYYPPLVHLVVAGAYKLFGVSMDVAALSNSLFLVIFLLAVYGLGEKVGGPGVGLLSALVVSFLPIIFSMSRYLYIDFALTSLTAVNLCLLLRSDRFRRKGYALLYGLSLGLGLLTKWTFIAFTAAPLLVILASPGVAGAVGRALRPSAWDRRRLLAATGLGLGLTLLWFLPNVEAAAALPLGYALVPLSWLLWSGTWYFVLAPAGQGVNLLAALGLGASLASAWYLTMIDFVGAFWLNAYGKPTGRSWGFGRYLDFLFREQLSPLFAALLVAAVVGLAWQRWRRTRTLRQFLALGAAGWALVLWPLVSFLIFSSRVSIVHSRYIMPLLPPLGIAIALWLSRLRPRRVRALLIGGVVAVALVQFSALSFDALDGLRARAPVFASGLSIQLPASGRTDPGYWAAPEALRYVEAHRDRDPARLGILVNEPQVNSKHFIYLAYADYPHVQVLELATVGRAQPVYARLFESDFVLLIDPPPHYARRPDTEATLKRLRDTPDDPFHRAFELAQTYPLPDGRRLLLYQRRFASPPDVDPAYTEALMADLSGIVQQGDAVAVTPPGLVYALARAGDGAAPLYPLAGADLADLGAAHDRLWLVLGDAGEYDPDGRLAPWLAAHFYRAYDAWYGPLQLVLYAPEREADAAVPLQPGRATWPGGIALTGYRFLDAEAPLGGVLRLELVWQAAAPVPERYKVFLHLVDGQGRLAAQRDSEPAAGLCPTSTWQPGEAIADRHGLWLPAGLPPGEYRLILGLYHAASGERLPACCDARGAPADAVPLAVVRVAEEVAHILDWNIP